MNTRTVHFLVYSDLNMLDLAGPLEVFRAANYFSKTTTPPYTLDLVGLSGTSSIMPGCFLSTLVLDECMPSPHTLIIPGGPGVYDFCNCPSFGSVFLNYVNKVERVVSVCTGAFALAATGQLKGRRATTHWSEYQKFENSHPDITVVKGPIFVTDGNIWTSGGITSGIDLSLSIVENDLGHSAALQVAKHLVVFLKRPGDQSQFSSTLELQTKSSEFSDLHAWVNENLSRDLTVPVLANYMNMSERTLMRKYKATMGQTPTKMVEMLRLDAVRRLLVKSRKPLKEVATITGLGDETNLIRIFVRVFGITPNQYKASFRSSLA
ncbi:helix-turn-helix domain-containing protein [Pseudomonas alliivorans]|nr:helix-turn-helix domain-containing protein [Pseudomonas alliivorans]MEE4700261.1 helix-turn-helix domain-containing protein [Pseudomonas alliivorans]MEE4736240.1 helix-turn-helix domain-containing protein [Pseudomonas alliivorans]